MEENKEQNTVEEPTVTEETKTETSENTASGQIAPEPKPKNNKTMKTVLIAVGIVLVCGLGYFAVNKYQADQEARRIDVVIDTETTEVAYGTDLMDLVTVNKADKVTVKLVDSEGNEVTEPKAKTEYTMEVVAIASDNTEEFEHTIVFIDENAPIISGVDKVKEVAFGSEFDALNGVTATDDVDGNVEVVLSGDEVNTKAPKEYNLVYTAKDLSENTATVESTVKVLEPTCGANASWNGSDCVCNSGYQGDAWAGCTAIPTKKPVNNKPANGSQGTASSGKSQAQKDCEASWGTWKDNSWCDWGSSNNNTSSSESSGNSGSGNSSSGNSGSGSGGCIPDTSGDIYPTMDACKAAGESGYDGSSWMCSEVGDGCGNFLGFELIRG